MSSLCKQVLLYYVVQVHTHENTTFTLVLFSPKNGVMKNKPLPLLLCVSQDKTVEIAIRLDHVAPVLEEIIHEIVEERQKGTRVWVVEDAVRHIC